ncbi:hypothetical protein CYMTET_44892 [Cymbomonas tetramitiformis]|uniref:Uncharacterized protein n=1 Tax=Cymbomonas tetramitiformis TaxID=36881 RepID=A0AAE0EZ45_9CHLO|nr:hypothetical protein CYMTET_44892 [Cymbomonas tetramitiformis]
MVTCEPGCWDWTALYFGDCVCCLHDQLSFFAGLASILAWGVAEIPQIYANFSTGKSEGVSALFICAWLGGDTLNICGCILSKALPTQLYTAIVYTSATVILLLQHIWYSRTAEELPEEDYLGEGVFEDLSKPIDAHPFAIPTRSTLASESLISLSGPRDGVHNNVFSNTRVSDRPPFVKEQVSNFPRSWLLESSSNTLGGGTASFDEGFPLCGDACGSAESGEPTLVSPHGIAIASPLPVPSSLRSCSHSFVSSFRSNGGSFRTSIISPRRADVLLSLSPVPALDVKGARKGERAKLLQHVAARFLIESPITPSLSTADLLRGG